MEPSQNATPSTTPKQNNRLKQDNTYSHLYNKSHDSRFKDVPRLHQINFIEPEECESIGLKSSGIPELGISYVINFEGRLGAHIYLPETNDKAAIYYPPFFDKPNLFVSGNKINISPLAYSKFNTIVFALSGQYLPEHFVEILETSAVTYAYSIGETHIVTKPIYSPFTPSILSQNPQSSIASGDTDDQQQPDKSNSSKDSINSPSLLACNAVTSHQPDQSNSSKDSTNSPSLLACNAATSHNDDHSIEHHFIEIIDDNDVNPSSLVPTLSTKQSQKSTDDVTTNPPSPVANTKSNNDTPVVKNVSEAKKSKVSTTIRSNFTFVTHKDIRSQLKPLYTHDFSQSNNPYHTISTSASGSYLFFLPQGSLSTPQQLVLNTAEEGEQPTYHELYIHFKYKEKSSRLPMVITFHHRQNDEFQDAILTKGGPLTLKVLAGKLSKDLTTITHNGYDNFGVFDEQGVVRTLFTLQSSTTEPATKRQKKSDGTTNNTSLHETNIGRNCNIRKSPNRKTSGKSHDDKEDQVDEV